MDNNMVFGLHPVEELIKADKEIEKIFVQSGLRSPQISEITNYARAHKITVQYVPLEKLNRLTRKNHQGVVAFICPISYAVFFRAHHYRNRNLEIGFPYILTSFFGNRDDLHAAALEEIYGVFEIFNPTDIDSRQCAGRCLHGVTIN